MRKDLATFKNKPLLLHVVETIKEAAVGYKNIPVKDGEGMFFGFDKVIPLPISIGQDGMALDVAWLDNGQVVAIATHYGGILSAQADGVLELPLGWCEKNQIRLGDRLIIGEENYA